MTCVSASSVTSCSKNLELLSIERRQHTKTIPNPSIFNLHFAIPTLVKIAPVVAKPANIHYYTVSVVSGYKSNSFSWLGSEDSGNG